MAVTVLPEVQHHTLHVILALQNDNRMCHDAATSNLAEKQAMLHQLHGNYPYLLRTKRRKSPTLASEVLALRLLPNPQAEHRICISLCLE
jgi:hypothetical protein